MHERRGVRGADVVREEGRRREIVGREIKGGRFVALLADISYEECLSWIGRYLERYGVDHSAAAKLGELHYKLEAALFVFIPESVMTRAMAIPTGWQSVVVKRTSGSRVIHSDEPEAEGSHSSVQECSNTILSRVQFPIFGWQEGRKAR